MSTSFPNWDDQTLDLAIERFTVGLDQADDATLNRLATSDDLIDFENTVASVHLAFQEVEAPPAEFLNRLKIAGRLQVANRSNPSSSKPVLASVTPLGFRSLAIAGWLVAAGLLLSFILYQSIDNDDPDARRAALIASASELIRIDWTATEDPAATGAGGDVVWNPALQEGYMRFDNLPPNAPEKSQYQLWIFDQTRANWEAKPVDGGVFDIPTNGEVIIPIDAKLTIREPVLFAITIEAPGGVVVSEREHLVLTAAL
ncbi:MAG: hypothetical protein ACI8TQ_002363 [Planctomycetota bacterium]|jgi:hypothetical protein